MRFISTRSSGIWGKRRMVCLTTKRACNLGRRYGVCDGGVRLRPKMRSWESRDLIPLPATGGMKNGGNARSGMWSWRAGAFVVARKSAANGRSRASMTDQYVELHASSAFSFLRGASSPEHIAERAAKLGLSAIALLDRNGVYGAQRFSVACRKHAVQPIIGSELTMEDGIILPVLVKNRSGYTNLC